MFLKIMLASRFQMMWKRLRQQTIRTTKIEVKVLYATGSITTKDLIIR